MAIKGKFAQWDQLKPLNELDENDLIYLYSQADIEELEPRSLVMAETGQLAYLLEGEVSLLSGGFVTESFTHLQKRALSPLFNEMLEEDSAILTSHGRILLIDQELFGGLYSQTKASSTIELPIIDLSASENELFQRLLHAFKQKRLKLPALPEAALQIRRVINNPQVGSDEIIQIVQTDPVLSARLVKIANSPLYGTWREIKTVRDAVRRLGLENTKNLSFSMSFKLLFSAKTSLIKQQIERIYEESIAIASIAYVITEYQVPKLDPDQALLSGLIQDLGLIPILKYIDEHPSLMQTTEQLGKTIDNLQLPISTLIFHEWNFDPEFLEIVKHGKDWTRDIGDEVDYCDIIIAARLFYLQQQDELPVPDLYQLPVIDKLGLYEYQDDGQFFIDKAEEEIQNMRKLLQSF
ncbi:MAG: HDOD domain-containing protein [Gammaproteobacteria bacterium]|nr:HDOD domain-containing protein [Gammaproteobacteria bacterium]